MVFYIYITCTLEICKDTGKHFYYTDFQKIYDMPPVIPEEYREYVKMTGEIFQIYTSFITDYNNTSVENFVDKFPEWSDILENSHFHKDSDIWNEHKHNKFYNALKWFSDKRCYMICWTD